MADLQSNINQAKNDIQSAAVEAMGLADIWFKRIRFGYDIASLIAFGILGIYFYFSHKATIAAKAEIEAAHQREQAALTQLSILEVQGQQIIYIVKTNYVTYQKSEEKLNAFESNARSFSNDWHSVLRLYNQ